MENEITYTLVNFQKIIGSIGRIKFFKYLVQSGFCNELFH